MKFLPDKKDSAIKSGKKRKLKIFSAIVLAFLLIWFSVCFGLYFFEDSYYYKPSDLSKSAFSFDAYKIFDKNLNPDIFIDNINYSDIVTDDNSGIKFAKNTFLLNTEKKLSKNEINIIEKNFDCSISGIIDEMNVYQFKTNEYCDLNKLKDICDKIDDISFVNKSLVDYFEETPGSSESNDSPTDYYLNYNSYYEQINAENVLKLRLNCENISIGFIDTYINPDISYLNVINSSDYDFKNFSSEFPAYSNHGSHVSGIAVSKANEYFSGICPGAGIVSFNGLNNTISYWLSSIDEIVCKYNTGIINVSMGYNDYLVLAASLGNKNAENFIKDEAEFFTYSLNSLLTNGHDFLIVTSAGNTNNDHIYKDNDLDFGYGQKKILDKIDILDIFSSGEGKANSIYDSFFNAIYPDFLTDKNINDICRKVSEHIIVVGSIDKNNIISDYSDLGENVDIYAPGENILSYSGNGSYIYMSGTSLSSPFVSGTAALMKEKNKNLTCSEIKDIILSSSDKSVKTQINGETIETPILDVDNCYSSS